MNFTTYGRSWSRLAGKGLAAATVLACFAIGLPSAQAQEDKTPSAYITDEQVEEDNLWLTLSVPLYNKYYYRGIQLYPDTSLQPSLSLGYSLGDLGTLGASVWAHIPVGKNQNESIGVTAEGDVLRFEEAREFVEIDPSIYYDVSLGIVSLTVGHLWYTDPADGGTSAFQNGERFRIGPAAPDTAEWFGGIALDTWLQPSLTVYHDYREFDYQYYALSFSQLIDSELIGNSLGEDFNVTPFVTFGFATNGETIYNSSSGLKHVNLGLRSTLYLGIFRVTPIVQYIIGNDDTSDGIERTEDDFIAGIDFAYDTSFSTW